MPIRVLSVLRAAGTAVLFLASVGVGTLSGQTPDDSLATLRGRVVSAMTGGPLEDARVVLVSAGKGDYTDRDGSFVIDGVKAGRDTVHVRLIGFAEHSLPIDLRPNRVTIATLMLSQSVLKLEGIRVEVRRDVEMGKLAGFRERERIGHGVFLSPEEIADKHAKDAADLLRGEPGVSVGPSTVGRTLLRITRYNRDCNPFIWLDGVPARGMHIDDLTAEEILALELYRGPAETPPQFQFRQGTCATLVVWTRTGASESRSP